MKLTTTAMCSNSLPSVASQCSLSCGNTPLPFVASPTLREIQEKCALFGKACFIIIVAKFTDAINRYLHARDIHVVCGEDLPVYRTAGKTSSIRRRLYTQETTK